MAIKFEYYLHEIIQQANPNLITNIGPRVGRKLADLRDFGILETFHYVRDDNNRLRTIITVGSKPTQILTFKNKMNEWYLQEKKWFKSNL